MIEANKYKLGMFVLTGISLLVVGLFMLGLSEALKPKINIVTYFDESVQGLNVGSSVKFRGVTIGKVTHITIRPQDNFIKVDMQAIPSSVEPSDANGEHLDFFENLTSEVKKGLRCRMELKGITGMKYVEFDYLEKERLQTEKYDFFMCKGAKDLNDKQISLNLSNESIYIPSTPSLMSGIRTSLSVALSRIANIDFKGLSTELQDTLKNAKKLLGDKKISIMLTKFDKLATNFQKMSEDVKESITKERLKKILKEFDETLKSVKSLAQTTQKKVKEAQISDTTKDIRELKQDFQNTLQKLDNTLDAITELAVSLDEDPSSIIRGKQTSERH